MKSSRLIAFDTLYKIFYDSAYSNIALDKALSDVNEDKPFISSLVYGVVERKLTLDYFINKYTDSKLKPKIRIILYMGAYQILFMDKVPNSAAVNESVKLAKQINQDFYSKLVNAVLRKISDDTELPDELSIRYSVPNHLLNMWSKQYGIDTVEEFLPCINEKPPVFAIPNRKYLDADELIYELQSEGVECDTVGDVVQINSHIDFKNSKAFNNGLFYIEDLSSYEAACALGACEGEIVYDMCSAPGGKAFTIANCMNNKGKIRCFDIYEGRINLIKSGAERLGIDIIDASVNDACEYNDSLPLADRILCDVPCSGFGIVRRKPEIRYKELDSVKDLPSLQLKILETSSSYLKKGGYILYSTCTLNKKENEKVVSSFLANHEEKFKLVKEKTVFPSANGGDGFYYALIKNED